MNFLNQASLNYFLNQAMNQALLLLSRVSTCHAVNISQATTKWMLRKDNSVKQWYFIKIACYSCIAAFCIATYILVDVTRGANRVLSPPPVAVHHLYRVYEKTCPNGKFPVHRIFRKIRDIFYTKSTTSTGCMKKLVQMENFLYIGYSAKFGIYFCNQGWLGVFWCI